MNGEIFLFGGRETYQGSALSTIYKARIDPVGGTIDEWVQAGTMPATCNSGMGAVHADAAGGVAYLIGEDSGDSSSSVWRNTRNGDCDEDGDVDVADFLCLLATFGL